jgi:hypothetical protein
MPPLSKQAVVDAITAAARTLGIDRLSQEAFLTHSGLSRWVVTKYFDRWSDACEAAGIGQGLSLVEQPRKAGPTEAECLTELKRVAALRGETALSSKQYDDYARISAKTLRRRFGSWRDALAAAGLTSTAAAQRQTPLTREHCIEKMQRVAKALGRSHLTSAEFDAHGEVSSFRIIRVFGPWHEALKAAGLEPSPNFIQEVPIAALADQFLQVCVDLGRIPTIN